MATVDWTQPIEAAHKTDGRVVPVKLARPYPDYDGDYEIDRYLQDPHGLFFHADGSPYSRTVDWFIRNVQPDISSTADRALRRMEALVERMAARADSDIPRGTVDDYYTARQIERLRKPVDPRFDKVLTILQPVTMTDDRKRRMVRDILAALDA